MSSRDPIVGAKAAKRLIQDGDWQRLPGRDDQTKILLALRSRLPWVLPLGLPVAALVALGQPPPLGGCHWCHAPSDLKRDDVTTTLLGQGCTSCRIGWEAAAVAARERPYVAQLVAAGFRPEAAGNLRTPEQVAQYTRMLRGLENAKLPPRQAATTPRRPPDPPYYQRRSWPVGAVR